MSKFCTIIMSSLQINLEVLYKQKLSKPIN